MNEQKNNTISKFGLESETSFTRKYIITGVIFGVIVMIISWLIGIIILKIGFTFTGIIKLHTSMPVVFFFDALPIFAGIIFYFVSLNFLKIKATLEDSITQKNEIIQQNVKLAKMIGEKDFEIDDNKLGQFDELGNSLMLMRNNLVEASKKESVLNWIAQGKDKISNILRLHNNIDSLAYETLVAIINYTNMIQGAFYIYDEDTNIIQNIANYAYNRKKYIHQEFKIGQGLIGQAAFEKDYIYRKEIPTDYVTITSGILGHKKPATLLIMPLISDEKLQGVVELASLDDEMQDATIKFIKELSEIIAQTLFNLKVNARTERLLKEARIMTEELRENEEELRQNAEEMRATQEELQKTNQYLEAQIREVENAQKRLHSLLENASEVISIYDENGIVKYESPSVKHILGYSPDEIVGTNAFDSIRLGDNNQFKLIFFELLDAPGIPRSFEYQYAKNDGEILWLEATGRNFLDNPAINGIIFNTRDITVRKIAEQAQRMSGQMQALSENSLDMIIRFNLEGRFFYINPVVEKLTGIDRRDITKKKIDEADLPRPIVELFRERLDQTIETLAISETELKFPTVNGERIMTVNAIPEFNEEKILETILIVAHDVTEQKIIELEIKDKNKQITDSINYAQRIQKAILPDNKLIREFLPESFILYKPRDVVSGDFPWFFQKGDNTFIAAVDCTGHGVPGALLSFIGYFILNNIADHDDALTAGEALDRLHDEVRKTLKQDKADANARDGMDIAFCKINFKRNELQFAGAHRPLYLLREAKLTQFKGNPKAIGGIPPRRKEERDFINYVIELKRGDKIFFFSDGLPDQVGGPFERKYQAKRIREEIMKHPDYSMANFSKHFARDFNKWKGENKQIDDVLLIGIEF